MSRAVHLELFPNLPTTEIIKSLRIITVRRGRPKLLYSDRTKSLKRNRLNVHVKEFQPGRNAKVVANVQIRDINTIKDNKRDICGYLTKWRQYIRN